MKNENFIIELIGRLSKSNPSFFKKLQWFAFIILVLSNAANFLIAQPYNWPGWVADVNKLLTSISGTAIFISFLPNKDVNDTVKQ